MKPSAGHKNLSQDFRFEVGQRFRRGTTVFRIAEERGALLKLEHVKTLECKVQEASSLILEYGKGLIVPATDDDEYKAVLGTISMDKVEAILETLPLDMYSKAQRNQFLSVIYCITELRAIGYTNLRPTPLLIIDFDRVKTKLRGSISDFVDLQLRTVYDWSLKLDKADGDFRAVLPNFHNRGGRGNSRLSTIADAAITEAVKALRADDDAKITPKTFEDRVGAALLKTAGPDETPLIMPSRSTLSRKVQSEFTAYERAVRNKGKAVADKDFASWYPRDRALTPLEVLEFDDKDSRVFLIDERSWLPYGRGYVTPGVDQYTLVPMGFSISEFHRSTWSAICALTNAILPKDTHSDEYSLVNGPVEFAGKPGIALFDNAAYNHAAEIDLATYETGITPAWAKPYSPREKSAVEGFNGRMDQDFFSTLPGYAGEKKNRDGLAEGTASAIMSVESFQQQLLHWVYDVYCNTPGIDGLTPRQRWHNQMRLVKPRFPLDIYRLRILPTLRRSVQFRTEGIRFTGLIYQNDRLLKLRKNLGHKASVNFRYDPRNMVLVYVFDPITRQLFVVGSATPEYTAGLSLYQHRLILKMARAKGIKNPSVPRLLAMKEELRTLVQQLRYSKKKRERAASRRAGNIPGNADATHSSNPKESKPIVITDLEAQVADIDDTEMEQGDEGWDIPVLF